MPKIKEDFEKLELQARIVNVTGKDGKNYTFPQYYVVINGVKVVVAPLDNTSREILADYYTEEE